MMKLAKFKKPGPKVKDMVSKPIPKQDRINIFVRTEKEFVNSARKFAKKNNMSLSTLIENYFRVIHENINDPSIEMPGCRSLKGILKGCCTNPSHYQRYLQNKYK
ncbi:MAG: DUF6364 family protein [Balneolales bacterium]